MDCLTWKRFRDTNVEVNHKNLNRKDNRAKNLEWVSRKQNLEHAWENGMKRKGDSHGMSKLSEYDASIIKRLIPILSSRKIGYYYGVCKSTILSIKKGATWSYVPINKEVNLIPLIVEIEAKYSARF